MLMVTYVSLVGVMRCDWVLHTPHMRLRVRRVSGDHNHPPSIGASYGTKTLIMLQWSWFTP